MSKVFARALAASEGEAFDGLSALSGGSGDCVEFGPVRERVDA
jgi:hypothetical protein